MKRFKKMLSLVMAVVMVVSVVNLPVKEAKAETKEVTFTGLHDNGTGVGDSGHDNGNGVYWLWLTGPTKAVIDQIGTPNVAEAPATVYIDGVENTVDGKYRAGSSTLGLRIPYSAFESGVEKAEYMQAKHVVWLKAGTKAGDYTITQDLYVLLDKNAEPVVKTDMMEFTSIAVADSKAAPQDANQRYRVFFYLKNDSQRNNTFNNQVPVAYVDGEKNLGLHWYNYGSTLGLHVPYSALESGVTTYSQLTQKHTVTIKAGSAVGSYILEKDYTVIFDGTYVYPNTISFSSIDASSGYDGNRGGYAAWVYGPINKGHIDALAASGKPKVYIDGVYTETAINYSAGGSTIGIIIPTSSLESGVSSPSGLTRSHIISFKAGTELGDFTVTSDFNIRVNPGYTKPSVPETVTFTGLGSGTGAQDGVAGGRYLIYLDGPTSTQIADMNGKLITVYVDGVKKFTTQSYYNDLSGRLAVTLPYKDLEDNVSTAEALSPHVVTFKAGTAANNYMIAEDFNVLLKGASVKEYREVAFTLGATRSAQDQDGCKRYYLSLEGATAEQITELDGKKVTFYVDGVETTGSTYLYKSGDNALNLLLYYNDLKSGATTAVAAGSHVIELRAGTYIDNYRLTEDLVFTVNKGEVLDGAVEIPELELNPGDILIENPSNSHRVSTTQNQVIHAGSKLTFDIELNEERNFAVWVYGDDSQYHEGEYNSAKESISVNIPKDIDSYRILVEYRNADGSADTTTDKTGMQAVVRNLQVHNGDTSVGRDGTITMKNPNAISQVEYYSDLSIPAGAKITFDVDVNDVATNYAVWILKLDGSSTGYAYGTGDTKDLAVSHTIADALPGFMIRVEFRGGGTAAYTGSDLAECEAVIKNLKISYNNDATWKGVVTKTPEEGGAAKVTSAYGGETMMYYMYQEVSNGSNIQFDIDLNLDESCRIYLYGSDGTTNKQFFGNTYDAWNGKTTISADITQDVTSLWVQVTLLGESKGKTTNVVTITNVVVTPEGFAYTPQAVTAVHTSAEYYVDYRNNPIWDVYLWVDTALEGYGKGDYYDTLMIDIGGKKQHIRVETIGDSGSIVHFILHTSDFPNGIQDNTIMTIYADKMVGYTLNAAGTDYQKNGAAYELTEDVQLYLNELGIAMGGYKTDYTPKVDPTLENSTSASQLNLSFASNVPDGRALTAWGETSGVFLNNTKLAGATLTCTTNGNFTLDLNQNASAGDTLVLRSKFADADQNYQVSFVVTQFTFNGTKWSKVAYTSLTATGVRGDANGNGTFNVADYVRYRKHMSNDMLSINDTDCDMNASGKVDEKDTELCKKMLLGTAVFNADGSNIAPGKPAYAAGEEVAIGALAGPRRLGYTFYEGKLVNNTNTDMTTDYRTDAEFEKYAQAGFNFVISDNDAEYGLNWNASNPSTFVGTASYAGSDLDNYMKLADKYDVDVIVSYRDLAGWLKGKSAITQTELNKVQQMMNDLKDIPNFKGIQMADEPFPDHLANYETVATYIQEIAPDAMLKTALLPMTNGEFVSLLSKETSYKNYLTNFGSLLGFQTYDYYPFQPNDVKETYLRNLQLSAEQAKGKYDTGVVIQSMGFNDAESSNDHRAVTGEEIAYQMYSSLAYGNKMITYYTYWMHPYHYDNEQYNYSIVDYPDVPGQISKNMTYTGSDGQPVELYGEVKKINNNIHEYGHILMDFTWQGTTLFRKSDKDNLFRLSSTIAYNNPSSYTSKRVTASSATEDAIMGCMKDSEGRDAYVIVNAVVPSRKTSTTVSVTFKDADRALVYSMDGDAQQVVQDVPLNNGQYSVTLAAGKGALVIPYKSN